MLSRRIVGKSERAGGGVRDENVSVAVLPREPCPDCGGVRPIGCLHSPQSCGTDARGRSLVRGCDGRRWVFLDGRALELAS